MARSITQTRATSRLRGMWRDQADRLGCRKHIHCAVQQQVNCARLQSNVSHGVSQRSQETGGRSTPVRVRIVGDARGRQCELEAQPAQMHVCPHRRGVPRLAIAIEIDRHAVSQRIAPQRIVAMRVRMTVLGMAVKVTMTRRGPVMPMRHVPLGVSVAYTGGHRRRRDQQCRQQPAKQILSIISTHRNTPSHSVPPRVNARCPPPLGQRHPAGERIKRATVCCRVRQCPGSIYTNISRMPAASSPRSVSLSSSLSTESIPRPILMPCWMNGASQAE